MAERSLIDLQITLDEDPATSETRFTWAGLYMLCLHTVIPQAGLALELHSAFVGHEGIDTHATHLLLAPPGQPAAVQVNRHEHENVDPTFPAADLRPRARPQLIEALQNLGWHASVNAPDERAFGELEHLNPDRS